jgi:hypothetical protein
MYWSHLRVGLAHISILLQVIYRALPGRSDKIVPYYCLMATWTGLGDNTELFWVVLSHLGLSQGLHLGLTLRLGLSLSSLVHSCSCIQNLNIELKIDK